MKGIIFNLLRFGNFVKLNPPAVALEFKKTWLKLFVLHTKCFQHQFYLTELFVFLKLYIEGTFIPELDVFLRPFPHAQAGVAGGGVVSGQNVSIKSPN